VHKPHHHDKVADLGGGQLITETCVLYDYYKYCDTNEGFCHKTIHLRHVTTGRGNSYYKPFSTNFVTKIASLVVSVGPLTAVLAQQPRLGSTLSLRNEM